MTTIITNKDCIAENVACSDSIVNIIKSIDDMNNPKKISNNVELQFLDSIITPVPGVQGHREGFINKIVYATDMGSFYEESYVEEYATWAFSRRGFTIKDKEISSKLLHLAEEEDVDIDKMVEKRMKTISDFFLKQYFPSVGYQTLFDVRKYDEDKGYYGEPIGFLHGNSVSPSMLRAYAKGDLKRNHYRAINSNGGKTSELDIASTAEYLSQYSDIENRDVIYLCNMKEANNLMVNLGIPFNVFANAVNKGRGIVEVRAGLNIFINDYIPTNWIFAVNSNAKTIITKLVSPKESMRGLALVKESGFDKLSSVHDLVGSKFKILPEGYHLTGRHQGCFLYTGSHNLNESDGNHTYPITDTEESLRIMKELTKHFYALKDSWYRGLR